MVTSGGQPSGAGDPRIRPSRRWYWVAGGVLAGGVVCVALAVAGFFALNRQIADFQRVPVPGQAGVTFTQPGGYVLYVEEPGQCCSVNVASGGSSGPFPSWSMDVALRPVNGGPQVSMDSWQGVTESYGITGHQGQAAMSFTIDHPGRYLLATRNATPGSITGVAVGRGIGQGILGPFILIVAGLLAALAGVVTGVITGSRRRARRLGPGPPVMPAIGDWRSAQDTPGEHAAGPRSYLLGGPAGFGEAIKHGLRDWLVYRGRASRSGYWWFILFTAIVWVALDVIVSVIAASSPAAPGVPIVVLLVIIAVLFVIVAIYLGLAELALLVRRLHDTGRSGWWVLIGLAPLVGPIILLVFTLLEGTPGPNRYDLAAAAGARQLRCLECGAENAEAAQVCARCGAPIANRPPAAPDAASEPGGSSPQPHELAGQRTKPGARRNALVIASGGLAALVAVIVVVALANSPTSSVRSAASTSPTASTASTTPGSSPINGSSGTGGLGAKVVPAPSGFTLSQSADVHNGPMSAADFNQYWGDPASLHFVRGYDVTYDSFDASDSNEVTLFQFATPADAAAFKASYEPGVPVKSKADSVIPGADDYDSTSPDQGIYTHGVIATKGNRAFVIEDITFSAAPAPLVEMMARQQYAAL
jgi:uncharacterized membrane protein YhaH (DUF805 family)